jgi:hypothetical protein
MKFRLKDGWLDYLFSGFAAGTLVTMLFFFQSLEKDWGPIPSDLIFVCIALASLAVVMFVLACKVKKPKA